MMDFLESISPIASAFAAILSTIIAAIVVWLTINQLKAQRIHNRLSIKPVLSTHFKAEKNDQNLVVSILLDNFGMGPGFIKNGVFYNAEGAHFDFNTKELKAEVERVVKRGTVNHMLSPFAVQPNTSVSILSVPLPPQFDLDSLYMELEKFGIKITYESVYGEKFEINETLSKDISKT
ncbi:hypothetical protein FM038_004540 [Shewanella eurypsychrophilus]|uniref:Uncharacterized protein n=1 Tax=Shewanella eurypsychrophilus TaxID=2593656 RepID=A0ABX6V498_9GAMM|nr:MULTISPECIES: hypothetical protein [Shewanella]QFU21484.1 hypothetical protein FS418_06120 [Shewanella sp. YLB-09]QPG56774.1 hypothetical protein FM038_004540 [Shewanella eurypsychrophilus]